MLYISFRFDDGHISQYNIGYKMLKEYEMVGSFYLVSDAIGKENAWPCRSVPYINFDQLKEMESAGNEIGCHSKTHSRNWIYGDENTLKYEICESLYDFRKNNIFPKTFCFPYTETSPEAISLCNKYYKGFVADYVTERHNGDRLINNFIPSVSTRLGIDKLLSLIKDNLNKERDEWLVITFHEIMENPSVCGVTEEDFVKIIEAVNEGVNNKTHEVITVYEGFKIFK